MQFGKGVLKDKQNDLLRLEIQLKPEIRDVHFPVYSRRSFPLQNVEKIQYTGRPTLEAVTCRAEVKFSRKFSLEIFRTVNGKSSNWQANFLAPNSTFLSPLSEKNLDK